MGKLRPDKRPFKFSTIKENNMSTSTSAKQQTIELGDLDLTQLAEIKKQLEEVTEEYIILVFLFRVNLIFLFRNYRI
jgi:hypothetical protein